MSARRRNRWLVGIALLMVSLVAIPNAAGIRINVSDSVARGLWITTPRAATVGAYVLICPPPTALFGTARERGYLPRGHCPGGFAPLMKQVVAIEGDQVDIGAEGMRINGRLLPRSAPRQRDGAGRALVAWPAGAFNVAAGEVVLYGSGTPYSFDARYFGPLPRELIRSVIEPVLLVDRMTP